VTGPLKIVDAYLLMQIVEATLRGLLWFGGLLFMVTAISAVRKVISNGIGIDAMLQMILYQVPRIILFALPMSVLFGTVQAFTELSTESEITAMAAGGMSLPRMMIAPLAWGAILAVGAFLLQELVVPGSQLKVDVASLGSSTLAQRKRFQWADPPLGKGPTKHLIQADRLDIASGVLVRPRIQVFNNSGLVVAQIEAERGQWDIRTNDWKFYKGSTSYFGRGAFGAWVPKNSLQFDIIQNDLAKAPAMGKLTKSNMDARSAMDKSDYEYVSIAQLQEYRAEMQNERVKARTEADHRYAKERVKSATFGIHDKIATPLIVLAMVLVGAPLGLRPPRAKGQGGVAMGISLAVLILYYITWTWCATVGKNGHGNPLIFAYFSPFLTFAAGAFLVAKKSR
jgi:lipopolysaccharide export system permease protein